MRHVATRPIEAFAPEIVLFRLTCMKRKTDKKEQILLTYEQSQGMILDIVNQNQTNIIKKKQLIGNTY